MLVLKTWLENLAKSNQQARKHSSRTYYNIVQFWVVKIVFRLYTILRVEGRGDKFLKQELISE